MNPCTSTAMAVLLLLALVSVLQHSTADSAPMPMLPAVAPAAAQVAPAAPRVVMLHMHDGVWFFQRLGTLTLANKRRYAARWRYEVVSVTPEGVHGLHRAVGCPPGKTAPCFEKDSAFDIDHTRAATFGKIKLARAACVGRPDHWLLWSDADAMVVNQSVPLETIIDDGFDLIFAYDWLMLNAGMLLIKCTPWTESFLAKVYDAREFDKARALDQSSIQSHLDKMPEDERTAHVKVIPKHAINVYLEEYRPGDFLLHMAGKLYEATEKGLWAIANQFDVLSRIDDPKNVASFFETTHLLGYYSGTCNRNVRSAQTQCLPDDDRRIRLREPLGAMSYPKRYRHVALRYYFLQNWKDKYDVPGWNEKKKALPMPVDSHRSEAQIVQEELRLIAERKAKKAGENAPMVAVPPPKIPGEKIPAVHAVMQDVKDSTKKVSEKKETGKNKAVNMEVQEDSSLSMWVTLLACVTLIVIAGCGLLFFYRKRRRSLKLQ